MTAGGALNNLVPGWISTTGCVLKKTVILGTTPIVISFWQRDDIKGRRLEWYGQVHDTWFGNSVAISANFSGATALKLLEENAIDTIIDHLWKLSTK